MDKDKSLFSVPAIESSSRMLVMDSFLQRIYACWYHQASASLGNKITIQAACGELPPTPQQSWAGSRRHKRKQFPKNGTEWLLRNFHIKEMARFFFPEISQSSPQIGVLHVIYWGEDICSLFQHSHRVHRESSPCARHLLSPSVPCSPPIPHISISRLCLRVALGQHVSAGRQLREAAVGRSIRSRSSQTAP